MSIEWYEKHSKDVTNALNKAKKSPKEEAVSCTVVKMSDGTHLLCANVAAGKAAALVKEAKSHGGKVVSSGSLYNGEDGITFAVSEGSSAVKKQFSDAALEATGKALAVTILADGQPPAPAAEAAPAAAPDLAAEFKDRARRVVAAVKLADKGVQATVQPLLVQALALGKESRFSEADALLGQAEQSLSVPAAPPAPQPVSEPAPPAPPAPPGDREQLTGRLKTLKPRYLEVLKTEPPNKAVLEKAMVTVVQTAKEGNFPKALKILDGLEKAVDRAAAPAVERPPVPAAEPTPEPAVAATAFSKSRERWLEARETAGKGMSALQAALRNDPDPRYQRLGDMGLNGISGRVQVGLEIALREYEANPASVGKARQAVVAFRKFITEDPAIELCDANPYKVTVGLRAILLPALNELEKALVG